MIKIIIGILFAIVTTTAGHAQTIAEKKAGLGYVGTDLTPEMQLALEKVNTELETLQKELLALYAKADELYRQKAPEIAYKDLLEQVRIVREKIDLIEDGWREMAKRLQ